QAAERRTSAFEHDVEGVGRQPLDRGLRPIRCRIAIDVQTAMHPAGRLRDPAAVDGRADEVPAEESGDDRGREDGPKIVPHAAPPSFLSGGPTLTARGCKV